MPGCALRRKEEQRGFNGLALNEDRAIGMRLTPLTCLVYLALPNLVASIRFRYLLSYIPTSPLGAARGARMRDNLTLQLHCEA